MEGTVTISTEEYLQLNEERKALKELEKELMDEGKCIYFHNHERIFACEPLFDRSIVHISSNDDCIETLIKENNSQKENLLKLIGSKKSLLYKLDKLKRKQKSWFGITWFFNKDIDDAFGGEL